MRLQNISKLLVTFLQGLHCLIRGHDMLDDNSLNLPFYAFVDSLKINLWDHKNLLIPHQFEEIKYMIGSVEAILNVTKNV